MISSAMGRETYTTISEAAGPLYPNLYVILVGPPGSGKTLAVNNGLRILRKVEGLRTGPDKMSPEAFVSILEKATQKEGSAIISLFLDELDVLLQKKGELDVRPILTQAYNCPDKFVYATERKGEQAFLNSCINILATTQVSWISENISLTDLGKGFPARLFLIHSDEVHKPPYFAKFNEATSIETKLQNHLKLITMVKGKMTWSDEAQAQFVSLTDNGIPPRPTMPHLDHYNTRRDMYLAKLAMILAKSRDPSTLELQKEDILAAMETLLEAEETMPHALSMIGGTQFQLAQTLLLSYMKRQLDNGKSPAISATEIHRFLTAALKPRETQELINSMLAQGIVSQVGEGVGSAYIFEKKFLTSFLIPCTRSRISR